MILNIKTVDYNKSHYFYNEDGVQEFFVCGDGMAAFKSFFNVSRAPRKVDFRVKNPKRKWFKKIKVVYTDPELGPSKLSVASEEFLEVGFCRFLKNNGVTDCFWVKIKE